MAITYPLALPTTIGVGNITLRAVNITSVSESPFTFSQQVFKHPGERWEASVSIPVSKADIAEDWVTFLVSLKGRVGTFLMGDPNRVVARGSAATAPGIPLVNGAGQLGGSVNIDGLPVSVTGYLLKGDYIQIGGGINARLHKVLNNVDSNALGQATLDIWPGIRITVGDNAVVGVYGARGLFRLASSYHEWNIDNESKYSISFEAVEVI